jgi:hypothetical protein
VYRYVTENVWVFDEAVNELYTEFAKMPKNVDFVTAETKCKAYVAGLIVNFFERGLVGLELANYYADDPVPETAKKVRCIKGETWPNTLLVITVQKIELKKN